MSANYTCNQFDKAFKPTRLGNWEVPKWHLNRPKGRSTVTKIIANDNGHLLPGVQKTDQKYWAGLYLGTYQLPKRISREIAIELSNPKCQTWMKRSYHQPFINRCQQNRNKNDKLETINVKELKEPSKTIDEEDDKSAIKKFVESAISNQPAAVADGSVVDTLQNRTSADGPVNSSALLNDHSGGDEGRKVDSASAKMPSSPALSRISAGTVGGGVGDVNDDRDDSALTAAAEIPRPPPGRRYDDAQRHHGLPDAIEDALYRSLQTKRHKHPGLGLNGCWPKCSAVAYKSFNDPGPTQCSKLRVYRPKTSLSSADGEKKEHGRRDGDGKHSRPKTCVPVMTADQLTDIKLALCWDLDTPFDRQRPVRPSDEPAVFHKVQQEQQLCGETAVVGSDRRQPPQNSSAVMGYVETTARNGNSVNGTPDSRRVQNRECLPKNRNLSAVMELIPDKDRGGLADRRKDGDVHALDKPSSSLSSSSSTCRDKRSAAVSSAGGNDRDSKSNDGRGNETTTGGDGDENMDENGGCYDDAEGLRRRRRQRRRRRSTPPPPPPQQSTVDPLTDSGRHRRGHDDATDGERAVGSCRSHRGNRHRPCLACENPAKDDNYRDSFDNRGHRRSEEHCGSGDRYKMAFKAGVPVSTPVKKRTAAAGQPAKHLRVPKPKTTNSDKKKYVIGTLLPPFSMWPGTTARDYPEHWRLTSVYRQAFKPLELRKQPLLQTVYL